MQTNLAWPVAFFLQIGVTRFGEPVGELFAARGSITQYCFILAAGFAGFTLAVIVIRRNVFFVPPEPNDKSAWVRRVSFYTAGYAIYLVLIGTGISLINAAGLLSEPRWLSLSVMLPSCMVFSVLFVHYRLADYRVRTGIDPRVFE